MGEGMEDTSGAECHAEGESNEDVLTSRQHDLNFVRKFWTNAGESRAEKFTKETGTAHTIADGLQEIGEHYDAMIDSAEDCGTPEAQHQADILRGRHLAEEKE